MSAHAAMPPHRSGRSRRARRAATSLVGAFALSVPLFATLDPVSASVAIVLELACIPLTGLAVALAALVPLILRVALAGDQVHLFTLLDPQRIGLELTEEFELVPERYEQRVHQVRATAAERRAAVLDDTQ